MNFEIVELDKSIVAGLTIPLGGREVTRRDLDLVNFTWDRQHTSSQAWPPKTVTHRAESTHLSWAPSISPCSCMSCALTRAMCSSLFTISA